MCTILLAHQIDHQRPLLLLANRDEFYNRPTAAAAEWPETPGLIAGRDLLSGGTWLAARDGRWGSVTNVREGVKNQPHHNKSRGWLVRDYLQKEMTAPAYLESIRPHYDDFAGFNLLLGDGLEIWYASNRTASPRRLAPGLYGLSNHLLDTPWPKVQRGKEALTRLLTVPGLPVEEAFAILADTTLAADADLPQTGIPLDWERALSAIFIAYQNYGTRCSTLLSRAADGETVFIERSDAGAPGAPDSWPEQRFTWHAACDLTGEIS